MRTLVIVVLFAAACGAETLQQSSTSAVETSSRLQAKLTVAAVDWERLWHPPDAGRPPPPPPDAGPPMMGMGPPPGPPPQAALDACASKAQGAACSFTDQGHTLTGTCGKTPMGQPVCMPAGMPPPPPMDGGMDLMGPMDPMAPPDDGVLGGTLAGLTRSPLLVKVTRAGDRVAVSSTNPTFSLEPDDSDDGGIDLSIDHGDGFEPAGAYRRVNP